VIHVIQFRKRDGKMPVLNFSYAVLKDTEAFHDYVQKAASLMQAQGVEVVVRGNHRATMRGDQKEQHVAAVFRYRDMESALSFYASDDYQSLTALRDKACEMEIQLYEK
jgi:uncharacterized protein (DUF1330 family)